MIRQSIFLVIVFASLAGCNTNGPKKVSATPPPPVDEIDRIYLQVSPNAVNWDGKPGPDGLEACVHMFRLSQPLPVTVRGTLKFTIFEGVISESNLLSARPFHSWLFDGETLKLHQVRLMMGWGYAMRLGWERNKPTTSSVTLAVEYLPQKGDSVHANPIAIPIGPR
ncbi:MAG: hypothetical protein KAV00_13725 [Phycisphaerae bacterium]|nr:hypothetical protein [Phycisphaerae bacterium]